MECPPGGHATPSSGKGTTLCDWGLEGSTGGEGRSVPSQQASGGGSVAERFPGSRAAQVPPLGDNAAILSRIVASQMAMPKSPATHSPATGPSPGTGAKAVQMGTSIPKKPFPPVPALNLPGAVRQSTGQAPTTVSQSSAQAMASPTPPSGTRERPPGFFAPRTDGVWWLEPFAGPTRVPLPLACLLEEPEQSSEESEEDLPPDSPAGPSPPGTLTPEARFFHKEIARQLLSSLEDGALWRLAVEMRARGLSQLEPHGTLADSLSLLSRGVAL